MALKDWKHNTKRDYYENIKTNKYIWIFDSKQHDILNNMSIQNKYVKQNGNFYAVQIEGQNSKKKFKTKPQALKFAKSYMRKH